LRLINPTVQPKCTNKVIELTYGINPATYQQSDC